MAKYSFSLSRSLTLCFIVTLIISLSAHAASEEVKSGNRKTGGGAIGNNKKNADSDFKRRTLTSGHYITYNSLNRDFVPCSRRGDSYKNCQPEAQAHTYSRGCELSLRCRH
ncbi:hypothetical protein LguiA_007834 [Lonicera macranthoides]